MTEHSHISLQTDPFSRKSLLMRSLFILLLVCMFANTAVAQSELPNYKQLDISSKFSYKDRPRSDWRSCETDNDCELFYYGCNDVIGINKESRKNAEKHYYERLHRDPRTMNCMRITDNDYVGQITPLCRKTYCGAWQHTKCLDPPKCTLTYEEKCRYRERIYTDPELKTYGRSIQELFALDDDQCREKCETFYKKRVVELTELAPVRLEMDCVFNRDKVLTGEKTFEQTDIERETEDQETEEQTP